VHDGLVGLVIFCSAFHSGWARGWRIEASSGNVHLNTGGGRVSSIPNAQAGDGRFVIPCLVVFLLL